MVTNWRKSSKKSTSLSLLSLIFYSILIAEDFWSLAFSSWLFCGEKCVRRIETRARFFFAISAITISARCIIVTELSLINWRTFITNKRLCNFYTVFFFTFRSIRFRVFWWEKERERKALGCTGHRVKVKFSAWFFSSSLFVASSSSIFFISFLPS